MEINNLQKKYLFVSLSGSSSFLIKLKQLGHIWIFNCFEGCQHLLATKNIKVSQIKKIIVTNNNIDNLGGLLGLLSTISLNTNINRIDIYGPEGLDKYVLLGRKYSYTSFRYKLYFHTISSSIRINDLDLSIYAFTNDFSYSDLDYVFIFAENSASFNLNHAIDFNVPFGPLFGFLKSGKNLILPDGFILYSHCFISGYYLGMKLAIINRSINKYSCRIIKNSTYSLYC